MLAYNSIQVLKDRYLLKNSEGKLVETPDQLFERVAKFVASCEEENENWEVLFYEFDEYK